MGHRVPLQMKSLKKLIFVVVFFLGSCFLLANTVLLQFHTTQEGRPYRVEINRIAAKMEAGDGIPTDFSSYHYVTHISRCKQNFYETDSDYVIRRIKGAYYRFDYTFQPKLDKTKLFLLVNGILLLLTFLVLGLLFFLKQEIIQPFDRLTKLPYELAKGSLSIPLRESKNRFFGRFLWGMDLLRETMEEQRKRELEMQKDKKMLLLSLSHDIKTPLSAILLYAKALSKGLYPDSNKQHEIAEQIHVKANEIDAYITQIITASREDFLSFEVHMGEFYLSELMQHITSYYMEKLHLLKTNFSIGSYSDCLLQGDLDRSIEVLQNIMENAIKYGDGKEISIRLWEEDGCMLLSITNTGCTLSDAELPHLFDSFWRGSNAKKAQGSGLGLYIARQLMCRMHGDIFAQIVEDTITITLVFSM